MKYVLLLHALSYTYNKQFSGRLMECANTTFAANTLSNWMYCGTHINTYTSDKTTLHTSKSILSTPDLLICCVLCCSSTITNRRRQLLFQIKYSEQDIHTRTHEWNSITHPYYNIYNRYIYSNYRKCPLNREHMHSHIFYIHKNIHHSTHHTYSHSRAFNLLYYSPNAINKIQHTNAHKSSRVDAEWWSSSSHSGVCIDHHNNCITSHIRDIHILAVVRSPQQLS